MYVQEITELRRQGELSKAFELAYNAWDRDKADPFLQMSLFWVLRDMCYRFFKHGYFDGCVPQRNESFSTYDAR